MTDAVHNPILVALFRLSRDTRHISASTLAADAGTTPTRAARALVELERQGLVDASRARLTMAGLARAVAAGAASGGPAREAAERPARAIAVEAPLAASPSAASPL